MNSIQVVHSETMTFYVQMVVHSETMTFYVQMVVHSETITFQISVNPAMRESLRYLGSDKVPSTQRDWIMPHGGVQLKHCGTGPKQQAVAQQYRTPGVGIGPVLGYGSEGLEVRHREGRDGRGGEGVECSLGEGTGYVGAVVSERKGRNEGFGRDGKGLEGI
jgi:hypothetical protein